MAKAISCHVLKLKMLDICVAFLMAVAMVSSISVAAQSAPTAPMIAINVQSSDASRVTGGDTLIEIMAAPGQAPRVTANGQDVSRSFKNSDKPGRYLGVVTGLKVGENMIAARQGSSSASLKVVNYPITGPVFAGAKEQPFICETSKFRLKDGTYLPEPKDANCSIDTVVTYVYKPLGGGDFKPLPSRKELPADVGQTTTTTGAKVPYVVRVETGTINRGIYEIAVLHDPSSESELSPVASPKGWNMRMAYLFAGGCGGMYRQGRYTQNVLSEQFTGLGYMTISNTLNVFANNCDDLLSAETAMMTRERAFELVGSPVFTVGWGCSGGSHQVLQVADNYPGILDGIMPMCTSVDFVRFGQNSSDVNLVFEWFKKPGAQGLTDEQRHAIAGVTLNTKPSQIGRSIATACPDVVRMEDVFDPKTNPNGVRCMWSDHFANSVGRDPVTGFGRRLEDNIGVQYGLGALQNGVITVKQFLDLNEQIGGYDVNGDWAPERGAADIEGVKAAYRSGRVLNGGGGLKDIPILEQRNYSDKDPDANHLKAGTYAAAGRVARESGNRDNYVILLESHRDGFYSASGAGDAMSRYAIGKMDDWLTAVSNDAGPGSKREKTIRNKPKDLVDSCFDLDGKRIIEHQTFSGGRCNELYPTYPSPRMVAGAPETQDVIKCQLKTIVDAELKAKFSPDEIARLKKIFPQGVCDWTKPGVGQEALAGTWQSF